MLESVFEQCAIVSGLVTEPEMISAWKEMMAEIPPQPEEVPGRLADIFVTRGIINRWQSQQLLAGRSRFTLGSYKIFDSIGHGGMGQVFKARHVFMDAVVAIKVLPREKATQSAIENFQNEIQSLASLNHPNLVSAIDAGMDGNVYYLVTEYVPGPDLRKLVRSRGPLRQESAASIIIQAARGLHHAHMAGLVHRDVKPGNILVTMNGIAKLSDLGLASPKEQGRQSKIVGTADYISPDQVRRPSEPNPIWDIYSLGCTLYYVVTGRVPYPQGTSAEKVKQHLDENVYPANPCQLNPLLSEDFADVIACMMAKNPQERIATAKEVIQFLSPWSDGTPRPIELADTESTQSESFQRSENDEFLPLMGKKAQLPAEISAPASELPVSATPEKAALEVPATGASCSASDAASGAASLPSPPAPQLPPVIPASLLAAQRSAGALPPSATAALPPNLAGSVAFAQPAIPPNLAANLPASPYSTLPAASAAKAKAPRVLRDSDFEDDSDENGVMNPFGRGGAGAFQSTEGEKTPEMGNLFRRIMPSTAGNSEDGSRNSDGGERDGKAQGVLGKLKSSALGLFRKK